MSLARSPLILPLQLLWLTILSVEGQRAWGNYGPLYESTRLLIFGESSKAMGIWNRAQEGFQNQTYRLDLAKEMLDEKQQQVTARLGKFFGSDYTDEWRVCSKEHELQVAHFNREIVDKYSVCRTSLETATEHLEGDIAREANFLSTASQDISDLAKTCKIWQLKQQGFDHAGVLLCTVSGIGGINQRISNSLEICDDILLEMSMEDLDTPSCLYYHEIKMQFDEVFAQIESCATA